MVKWPGATAQLQHDGQAAVTDVGAASMGSWWRFEAPTAPGGYVYAPNAAHLTVDLAGRFEPRWWLVEP